MLIFLLECKQSMLLSGNRIFSVQYGKQRPCSTTVARNLQIHHDKPHFSNIWDTGRFLDWHRYVCLLPHQNPIQNQSRLVTSSQDSISSSSEKKNAQMKMASNHEFFVAHENDVFIVTRQSIGHVQI